MQDTMMTARSRLKIRQKSRERKFQCNLKDLLNMETMVDVTLACDGQHIRVHKLILAASSPYFRELLTIDKNPAIFFFKDVTYTQIQCIVEYMYTGEISCTVEEVASLLLVAKSLKIEGLADMESDSIFKKLSSHPSAITPKSSVSDNQKQTSNSNDTNDTSFINSTQGRTSKLGRAPRRGFTSTSPNLRSRLDEITQSSFFPSSHVDVTVAPRRTSRISKITSYAPESENPLETENNQEEVIISDTESEGKTIWKPPMLARKKIFKHTRRIPTNYPNLKSSAATAPKEKVVYSLNSVNAVKPTDRRTPVVCVTRLPSKNLENSNVRSTQNPRLRTYSKLHGTTPEPSPNDVENQDKADRPGRSKAKPKRFQVVVTTNIESLQTPSTTKHPSLSKDYSLDTKILQSSSFHYKSIKAHGMKDTSATGAGDYSRLGLLRLNIRKPEKEIDLDLTMNEERMETLQKSYESDDIETSISQAEVQFGDARQEAKRRKLFTKTTSRMEDCSRASGETALNFDLPTLMSGNPQATTFDSVSNSQVVLLPNLIKYEPEDTEALDNPSEFG